MQQILNTLYVTITNAYLHLENDTVRIDVEREKRLQVPLHHLGSIVCFGNTMLSPALMHRLADNGIALVLLDSNGRFKARLEGPVSGNILLRRAQHGKAGDAKFTLNTSRNCIAGKIKNCRQVLLRGAREAANDEDRARLSRAVDDLAASLRALPDAPNLDTLRGIEGEAARQYFASFNTLIRGNAREYFVFDGRNRRPPRDAANALLSFLYALMMNDCRSALETVGLDPQLGFLHAVRPGRAALALDLMEELRPLADRLALTLVNRLQVAAEAFDEREGGAVMLQADARKAVVLAFQERKQELLTHPLLAESVPLGLVPLVQARLLARHVRGEAADYPPFAVR